MRQCNIFCSIIFAYTIIMITVLVSLFLCYETQSFPVINVMAAADNIVPACLHLALCLSRLILGHPAG